MQIRRSMRAAGVGVATLTMAMVMAACGSSSSDGGGTDGGGSSSDGIAEAQATVDKFAANPPLEVPPLPKKPDSSTYAIALNCTIPACAPGALKPAMDALGFKFDEFAYDLAKGPAGLQDSMTRAVAAKPDVILISSNYPTATVQPLVDKAVKQGIKVIGIGTQVAPNYAACIQCDESLLALGSLATDIVLTDAKGKADIAVAYDKNINALEVEYKGVKQRAEKIGDGSKVLEIEQSVTATPQENSARIVSFLQRNPTVKYLVASQQFISPSALKSAGLGSRVKLVGIYPLNSTDVEAVKKGDVVAYATGEFASLYWRAADAAARAVQDAPIEPNAPIQALRVINKENAADDLLDPSNFQDVFLKAWGK